MYKTRLTWSFALGDSAARDEDVHDREEEPLEHELNDARCGFDAAPERLRVQAETEGRRRRSLRRLCST